MKVLITIPCLLTGGTEIQTLNLVRALVRGGHEVTTACYFEHVPGIVRLFEEAGSRVVLFSKDGKRIGGLKGIAFLWRNLRRVRRETRPHVAHVQYMAPGAIPIVLLWLMGQRNILATAHTNADVYGPKALRLLRFLQRHVLRAFTCITLRAERNFFGSCSLFGGKADALPPHAHLTIYNALPGYIEVGRRKPGSRKDGAVTIGVVSRLEEIKGMDLVVPAFARVRERHGEVRLLVVGDGHQRQRMEEDARRLGLEDAVEFVGRQGQDVLQGYYDRIDILLMPSRSEGFGLTAIEGMARGCVLVASDTGGLPEVVSDGKVGLLHRPGSEEDLAEKICRLMDHPDMMARMQAELPEYVAQFTFDRYARLFNELYDQLK